MSALRAEIVSDPAELPRLETDWRRLWCAQPRREVFTAFEWGSAAWHCFGTTQGLQIVLVRRDGAVVGLLPLVIDDHTARFLSGSHADYNDMLVCDPEPAAVAETALRELLRSSPARHWSLAQVPDWSTLSLVRESLPRDILRRLVVEPGQPCPALRLAPNRDAVLAAMLGKQSLKRHEKKLARLGPVTLRHVTCRDEARAMLPDFFAQHIARRAVAGGRSHFLGAQSCRFFADLLDRFDPGTTLRFAVLEVGGKAMAYHMGFEVAGRFTWYKPSFDVDVWDCGPGEVLIKKLLEYLKDQPVDEFDFTRGGESFKDRFSNHQGRNADWTLHCTRSGALMAQWRTTLKLLLKQSKRVSAARKWWESLRVHVRAAQQAARGPLAHTRPPNTLRFLGRILWSADDAVILSARTTLVRAHGAVSALPADMNVTRASLRTLANWSVTRNPFFDIDGLARLRERLAAGACVYLGQQGGTLVCMATLRTGTAAVPSWSPAGASHFDLPVQAGIVEVQCAGPVDAALALVKQSILAAASEAQSDELWIVASSSDGTVLQVAGALGFSAQARARYSSFLAGLRQTTAVATAAQPAPAS